MRGEEARGYHPKSWPSTPVVSTSAKRKPSCRRVEPLPLGMVDEHPEEAAKDDSSERRQGREKKKTSHFRGLNNIAFLEEVLS